MSATPKTDCLVWWPYPCILWSVTTFGLWVLCLVWQREGEVMGRITSWEHGTSPRVTNWLGFPGMEWFPGMQNSRYQHWGTHSKQRSWSPDDLTKYNVEAFLMSWSILASMATNATESQLLCVSDEHTPNTTSKIFFLAQNPNLNIKKSVDIIS